MLTPMHFTAHYCDIMHLKIVYNFILRRGRQNMTNTCKKGGDDFIIRHYSSLVVQSNCDRPRKKLTKVDKNLGKF